MTQDTGGIQKFYPLTKPQCNITFPNFTSIAENRLKFWVLQLVLADT